ncbi:MAG TPA: universal stress protein [Gaiellaceae bacterium]|nr:universal stress protein [Gaiellaceae bacterium]
MSTPLEQALSAERIDVFDRVLVEVDETPESLVAAAQAKCLVVPGGELELLGVVERATAAQAGAAAVFAADAAEAKTALALEHAKKLLEPTSVRFVSGRARDTLLAEAATMQATLVAVGLHSHGRRTAKLFGTLDAAVLREAPCSVLVSRPGWGVTKPKVIVVGVDGSPESAFSKRVAQALGERLGAEVRVVIALGGKPLDESVYGPENADALIDPRDPPSALAADASACELVVIGHRGAHGAPKLGRVGERVVYRARSSVLVVRPSAQRR